MTLTNVLHEIKLLLKLVGRACVQSAWEPQKLAVHAVLDAFHRGAHLKASPLLVCDLSLKKKKKKEKAETALGSASLSDLAPPYLACVYLPHLACM